jgi:1,4-dihydroxy-2-naphthoate octaprenyltransferase
MPIKTWITGARVRTLPLAVAPIILGSASASVIDRFNPLLATLALFVALLLQIGVNYANDYSDGIKGTDESRQGPTRITASGLARPAAVKEAALISFSLAMACGLAIVIVTQQWWLIAVGLLCVFAAWFYTGGNRPYGYHGLGELAVFIFFGLVATVGTNFIQTLIIDPLAFLLGGAFGLYASAVLLVNNIRDLETDSKAGKRTLAVIVGPKLSRAMFILMIWIPVGINFLLIFIYPATILGMLNLLMLLPITVMDLERRNTGELITALKLTSLAGLGFGALVGAGIYLANFA